MNTAYCAMRSYPFEWPYVHHYPYPLDEERASRLAAVFNGEHDFTPFAASDDRDAEGKSKVRTVFSSALERRGPRLIYAIRGSGFLKHMVRNIVGTLIEAGKGNIADLSVLMSDMDFDELFTKNKPVIFAFHAYPWLIHRLTYRRTNHDNIHVRGYKEEGTITTPFDMTVLNELDRFHLVMDAIDRVPQTGDKGIYLKQQLKDKLIEHKQYIDKNGSTLRCTDCITPILASIISPPRVATSIRASIAVCHSGAESSALGSSCRRPPA